MKPVLLLFLVFVAANALAQTDTTNFHNKNWKPPYQLDIPAGWGIERFTLPPSFAPAIKYNGIEDIRFAPNWGKADSAGYWTYAFLWYLDGTIDINEQTIERDLTAYYTGLFNINTDRTKTDSPKLVTVKVTVTKKQHQARNEYFFDGDVTMNDFMTLKPITLNFTVQQARCQGSNKTFVFFQLSPKPFSHPIWEDLGQLWNSFRCSSKP